MARNKTIELPAMEGDGVAPKKIPAIEKAADAYVDIRDKRMALTEKEVAARAVLIQAMHDHSVQIYRFDDQIVELKPGKEKVRVKTASDDGEEEEEDD